MLNDTEIACETCEELDRLLVAVRRNYRMRAQLAGWESEGAALVGKREEVETGRVVARILDHRASHY